MFMGVRGSSTEDKWHRWHNDHKLALISIRTWMVVCERVICYNCTTAPWQGHGYFGQISAAAREYFRTRTSACSLFRMMYKDLSRTWDVLFSIHSF